MNLHQLLQKIENKQAVNFDQVIKKLPAHITWQSMFTVQLVSNNKHLVSVKELDGFKVLLDQSKPPETRQQAANHTIVSSHHLKCDSAYMLCFPANANTFVEINSDPSSVSLNNRPLSAMAIVENSALHLSYEPSKNAILIENQDCFFQWHKFLKHFASSTNIAQSDVYFSAGKRILNPLLTTFLSKYESIQCAFDYDFAGLDIADRLSVKLQATADKTLASSHECLVPTSMSYLLPDNINNLAALFTFQPISTNEFHNMLQLCDKLQLGDLKTQILAASCFMEQEALLCIKPA